MPIDGGSVSASPKVVNLHRPPPRAVDDTAQLVETLRGQTIEALRERLDIMFDGADDLLFEFAERAASNQDRRVFLDTMRAVRLGRQQMTRHFCSEFSRGFGTAPATVTDRVSLPDGDQELRLQSDEAIELDIAVANMSSKADSLYRTTLWDLGGLVRALVEDHHAPMSTDALTPLAICRAFRSSAESLDVDFEIVLVVFKLFDRLVIGELGELYQYLQAFLRQQGLRSIHAGNAGSRPGTQDSSASSPVLPRVVPASPRGFASTTTNAQEAAPEFRAPAGLARSMLASTGLDPQTLASLRRISAVAADTRTYSNASLAADLAAAASGQTVGGWTPRQSAAYVQRASLVGHLFNELLADPNLPPSLHGQFDGLRLSTMKVALQDIAFIVDPDHPVRGLINELATMAATARAGGPAHMARIAELVGQIQQQFDIAADALREPPAEIELVELDQAERFIEQQLAQAAERRQAIVRKVRRIIAEELQLRTAGIAIDDTLRPLLHSLWAPMMAMHLLHRGPDSLEWQRGIAALERITAMLAGADRGHDRAAVLSLRADLEKEFRAVGLTEGRIRRSLDDLETALSRPAGAAPAAEAAPDPAGKADDLVQLLEQLVQPGAWFLIHDHDRQQRRWMKTVAYYAGLDCAAFAEFDGGNTLLLKSRMLLDDLLARRSVPVDLGPSARAALDRYLARAA